MILYWLHYFKQSLFNFLLYLLNVYVLRGLWETNTYLSLQTVHRHCRGLTIDRAIIAFSQHGAWLCMH